MSEFTNFSLEGKVALVTGASYGIGFAIASAYAECGATICFNDIKQELVDKGMAAYAEKGIKAHGYVCDVTNEEAVNAMVAHRYPGEQRRYHQENPHDRDDRRSVPSGNRRRPECTFHRIESSYPCNDQEGSW